MAKLGTRSELDEANTSQDKKSRKRTLFVSISTQISLKRLGTDRLNLVSFAVNSC